MILAASGTFSMPTVVNQTGSVGASWMDTPRAVLFWCSRLTGVGAGATVHLAQGFAALHGGVVQQCCWTSLFKDAVTPTLVAAGVSSGAAIMVATNDGVIDAAMKVTGFTATGFTYQQIRTDGTASNYIIEYLILGGSSLLDAAAGVHVMPLDVGEFTIPFGFEADCLFLGGGGQQNTNYNVLATPGPTLTGGSYVFGIAGRNGQRCVGWAANPGQAASDVRSVLSNVRGLVYPSLTANIASTALRLTTLSPTGATFDKTNGVNDVAFCYLALKGGTYVFADPVHRTSLGTSLVAGDGVQAAAVVGFGSKATSYSLTPFDNLDVWAGHADNHLAQGMIMVHGLDNLNPTDTSRHLYDLKFASTKLRSAADTFTETSRVKVNSMLDAGVTLEWEIAAPVAWRMALLLIGPAYDLAPTPAPPGVWLQLANPSNLAQVLNLKVVVGSWHEETEYRGDEGPSFSGTYLSTIRDPKQLYSCTVEFATVEEYNAFRLFIATAYDSITGRLASIKPMYMVSPLQGSRRGYSPFLAQLTLGKATAGDQPLPSGIISTWSVDLTIREI